MQNMTASVDLYPMPSSPDTGPQRHGLTYRRIQGGRTSNELRLVGPGQCAGLENTIPTGSIEGRPRPLAQRKNGSADLSTALTTPAVNRATKEITHAARRCGSPHHRNDAFMALFRSIPSLLAFCCANFTSDGALDRRVSPARSDCAPLSNGELTVPVVSCWPLLLLSPAAGAWQ